VAIEHDLSTARARAARCEPNSPSWGAAIDVVETLERQLWVLERMIGQPGPVPARPLSVAREPSPELELVLVAVE
jgi:hypothetical protein